MTENLEGCCRVCLDVDSDHVSVLDNMTVVLHLKYCLGITVAPTDELPKSICSSCVTQLGEFYNFQLNARFSQGWLESSVQERGKKSSEIKPLIQPLPDSEYNSDSLLEFLNNTANIEEYLNSLGKDDIPSIVSLLDKNAENSLDGALKANANKTKQPSPRKKEKSKINMDIDVLDSEIDVVTELLKKETEPKKNSLEKKNLFCFACSVTFETMNQLAQHISTCEMASRTCIHCKAMFNSKQKMQQHSLSHNLSSELTCNCGKQFVTKEKLIRHLKVCHIDYTASMGCIYRCKQCRETFRERFQLYKHAKQHVVKEDERVCDVCGHNFPGEEALSNHRKEEHRKSNDLLYRCKICSYTSPDHKDVYRHVQTHLDKEDKSRHLCETCGRCFATKATLMRHTLQHEGLPKCNICHKQFSNVKSRDTHVLEHVETTMCDKCGQNVNSYKLESHICL